jgi:hypothetical protein
MFQVVQMQDKNYFNRKEKIGYATSKEATSTEKEKQSSNV